MLERVVAEGLEGAKIKTCVENEIIRSGWREYGSIHENRVMMVGSKDTAAKDDRFSLWFYYTSPPPSEPHGKISQSLILKSKFNVDDDDPFRRRVFGAFIVWIVIKDACRWMILQKNYSFQSAIRKTRPLRCLFAAECRVKSSQQSNFGGCLRPSLGKLFFMLARGKITQQFVISNGR